MIEDGIPAALDIDVEEKGDAQRQEEREDVNGSAGDSAHRFEYVEFTPALSSRSGPLCLPGRPAFFFREEYISFFV
jgi:hypothetical protein